MLTSYHGLYSGRWWRRAITPISLTNEKGRAARDDEGQVVEITVRQEDAEVMWTPEWSISRGLSMTQVRRLTSRSMLEIGGMSWYGLR